MSLLHRSAQKTYLQTYQSYFNAMPQRMIFFKKRSCIVVWLIAESTCRWLIILPKIYQRAPTNPESFCQTRQIKSAACGFYLQATYTESLANNMQPTTFICH